MKKHLLFAGILTFVFLFPTNSWADFCDLEAEEPTFYRSTYCETRLHGNSGMEEDILDALEIQMEIPAQIIDDILEKGDAFRCPQVEAALTEEGLEGNDQPLKLRIACQNGDLDGLLNLRNNLWIAYNKEKAIQITQKKLEIEFRESEKYWDGNLHNLIGTPFDLIVDLNLLGQVLFGSQSTWTYDVFTFPENEEESGGEESESSSSEGGSGGSSGASDDELEGVEESGETGSNLNSGNGGGGSGEAAKQDIAISDEFIEANCLPNQGSVAAFPRCGNGVLETELGEICDDGNQQAGDGCSGSCLIEETGSGGLNMCIDPEAVTFRDFADVGAMSDGNKSDQMLIKNGICPAGTHLKPGVELNDILAANQNTTTQSENYPGPFIGGTFKQFPESNRPPCPPGQAEVEITLLTGERKMACIPNETCTDFNKARGALFGEGWEQDEEKVAIARSIEALFCVSIIPWDGPENPYDSGGGTQGLSNAGGSSSGSIGPNEGCVDCHIRGIAKSLEEALETNVTPQATTMGAFEPSNRWGPNVSFNLTTMVRSKIRAANVDIPDEPAVIKEGLEQAEKEAAEGESSIPSEENQTNALARGEENEDRITEAKAKWLKDYGMRQDAAGDVSLNQTLDPMLRQMESIFEGMHENYSSMADTSARLADKRMCTF